VRPMTNRRRARGTTKVAGEAWLAFGEIFLKNASDWFLFLVRSPLRNVGLCGDGLLMPKQGGHLNSMSCEIHSATAATRRGPVRAWLAESAGLPGVFDVIAISARCPFDFRISQLGNSTQSPQATILEWNATNHIAMTSKIIFQHTHLISIEPSNRPTFHAF
jgi:hypothetical protein